MRIVECVLAAVAAVACTSSAAAAAGPPTPNATNLLWLPLGDSITFGCGTDAAPRGEAQCLNDNGGYRVPLAWSLAQQGYNVSTMGTLTTGPTYAPPQWLHHEGHPGWRFDQIDAILTESLATAPAGQTPGLVTIHLGTNDCGQAPKENVTVPTIVARADSLLAHLFEAVPSSPVYLASMIGFPGEQDCATAVNKGLQQLVSTYHAKGMTVCYAPVAEWAGVCVLDPKHDDPLGGLCCSGEVHPTANGYLRMASAFGLAIAESTECVPVVTAD